MFKVKDKFLYEKYKSWTIVSVTRTSPNAWHCSTKKGKFLIVKLLAGMVQLSADERENVATFGGEIVASYSGALKLEHLDFSIEQTAKLKQILSVTPDLDAAQCTFKEIASFFDWRYEEDDVWDVVP